MTTNIMDQAESTGPIDFSTVTERVGDRVTNEALMMLYTRYIHAQRLGEGKRVLEIACGHGQGLGLLSRKAKRLVAGDYTFSMLREAHGYYGGKIPLLQFDAQELPFKSDSFEMVLLFEAIYYLQDPSRFLSECHRVLADDGILFLCNPNCEWSGFNPSPFSRHYYTARQLESLLKTKGFDSEMYGAFTTGENKIAKATLAVRRAAVKFHLIPKTMKGKELFKRLFYGRLRRVEAELREGITEALPLIPLQSREGRLPYKVIYAIARKRRAS